MRHSVWIFMAIALGIAGACGADDSSSSDPLSGAGGRSGSSAAVSGRGTGTVSGSSGSAGSVGPVGPPTFVATYQIIMARCTGATCHIGATKPGGGLAMNDRASAYKALVGVNAASCRGEKRVVASNPDKSELVHVLTRTMLGTCNPPQMPEGQPKLPQNEIDTVSAWIKAGAPNN
jgi:hypothetical protein